MVPAPWNQRVLKDETAPTAAGGTAPCTEQELPDRNVPAIPIGETQPWPLAITVTKGGGLRANLSYTGATGPCTAEWGDNTSNVMEQTNLATSHTYAQAGTYTVEVTDMGQTRSQAITVP